MILKQVIPFRYEWFDELSTEVVTFTFFAMTAYKFQPASNNPYLQLNQADLDEDADSPVMIELNGNGKNDDEDYTNETVLDLTEQRYFQVSNNNVIVSDDANGNNLLNSNDLNNVFSRKQANNFS